MGSAASTPSAGSANPAMRRPVAGATGRSPSGSAKSYTESLHDVVDRSGGRIAGGMWVPTTAEGTGDAGEVVKLGAHRHRPMSLFDLLEHRGHLSLLSGAHDVDDAFDFLRSRVGPFLVGHNGIHQS